MLETMSNVNVIRSIVDGNSKQCPNCGGVNEAEANFCELCGHRFEKEVKEEQVNDSQTPFTPVDTLNVEEDTESVSVFAEGLPAWNIEPPQIMVRRKMAR